VVLSPYSPPACVLAKIWDTAGQEKYHSLAPMYYKGAAAAIVVTLPPPRSLFTLFCSSLRHHNQLLPLSHTVKPLLPPPSLKHEFIIASSSTKAKFISTHKRTHARNARIHDEDVSAPPYPPHLFCPFACPLKVYDITKRKTFETLQQWVAELKAQGPENIIIAIAGNKSDLETERQVQAVWREGCVVCMGGGGGGSRPCSHPVNSVCVCVCVWCLVCVCVCAGRGMC
jgi:hypothetical protein